MFSPNTPLTFKKFFSSDLRIAHHSKGMGVYVDDRQAYKRNFNDLLGKLQRRLTGWKSKLLSQADCLTLIKFVFQSNPVYKFSSF